MIPVGDVIPSRTPPRVTVAILVAFAVEWVTRRFWPETFPLILTQGVEPARFSWLAASAGLFAHTGLVQLATNILALWICGRAVEDRLGHTRFLSFYVLAGFAGTLTATWTSPASLTPVLGASAGVAGVIAGYLVLFPRSRILVMVPARDGLDLVEIPALLLPGFWFLSQLIWTIGPPSPDGLGISAHVGGAVAGAAAVWIFKQPARLKVEWWGA